MNSFLRKLQEWFDDSLKPPVDPAQRIIVRRQFVPSRHPLRRGAPAIVVQRDPRPYWEQRGWQQHEGDFTGYFQTDFGKWPGKVSLSPSHRVEIYIHNPPEVLQRHPHWHCFQPRRDGWYFVHPFSPVSDISAGILGVEKTLTESYAL